jgi:hypothetical protein
MATENKQSVQIVTLDGYPFTGVGGGSQTGRLTGGQNAAQEIQQIEGVIAAPTTGVTLNSYYQVARIPSTAVVKSVEILAVGQSTSTFTADVTIGVSDSTIDGTQPSLQVVPSGLTGTPPVNAFVANPALTTTGLSGATGALFAAAAAIGGQAVGVWLDYTFLNSANQYTPVKSQQPLWQAAGYAQDTGGFFDIVLLTTATTVASAIMTILGRVRYTIPTG